MITSSPPLVDKDQKDRPEFDQAESNENKGENENDQSGEIGDKNTLTWAIQPDRQRQGAVIVIERNYRWDKKWERQQDGQSD
jgi:hypothetical protein